mmetsp:Transcript_719/g.484  ORF Transcript_719/g.484 Transcript_719/m.484 type:complete len:124 (+) Transcript_719:167-538(+)
MILFFNVLFIPFSLITTRYISVNSQIIVLQNPLFFPMKATNNDLHLNFDHYEHYLLFPIFILILIPNFPTKIPNYPQPNTNPLSVSLYLKGCTRNLVRQLRIILRQIHYQIPRKRSCLSTWLT